MARTLIAVLAFALGTGEVLAQEVSFRHEVMAVLSRAGCNQGTCHGNLNGKNGFKLSLRGEDPDWDLRALTRDTLGRRVNPNDPASSLILLKASGGIPHEGGIRFPAGAPEYQILRRWIAAGAWPDSANLPEVTRITVTPSDQVLIEPAHRVQLRVQAEFSDGKRRDVTSLACFEPTTTLAAVTPAGEVQRLGMGETGILVRYLDRQALVRLAFVPARPGYVWPPTPEANYIDQAVFAKLRALRIQPSTLCPDSVFLRRAYLDTLGILPTVEEARRFLNSAAPDKRARLIDELLGRPEFADAWALKWSDLLRNEEKTLDRKGVQGLHQWLRQAILEGKPLNEMARELVAARGSTYSVPPANYYRALRDTATRAETTAQVFLGIRLQCARCHNHPFDRWKQDDYFSLASFFARVQYTILENERKDRLDKHEFIGEQIVWMSREGEEKHPRTGQAVRPYFLDEPGRPLGPEQDRLLALADWIARRDNPFFAKAQANRIWYHLLGRGIVEPIDDFRLSNPPVNPPLLDALARDLADHGFDLHHLVRRIMNSRTYQLAAVPNETNREDETNFSHAIVRPLQAEQYLDAFAQVAGGSIRFNGYPEGLRAGQLPGVQAERPRDRRPSAGDQFMKVFGKPERLLACECERSDEPTLARAFQLISGPLLNDLLSREDNRLGRMLAAGLANEAIIDELYLAALARPPTDRELRGLVTFVESSTDRRKALEDVAWGILNSKEFLLRQ